MSSVRASGTRCRAANLRMGPSRAVTRCSASEAVTNFSARLWRVSSIPWKIDEIWVEVSVLAGDASRALTRPFASAAALSTAKFPPWPVIGLN